MRLPAELAKALAAQAEEDLEAGYHPALTEAEVDFNFVQARAMIVPGEPIAACALLNRPLAVGAGGLYHAPDGDVFASADEPEYVALAGWVQGAGKEICK